MQANDLFKQSLRLAGITLRRGRGPATQQLAEALTAANSMLGRWSANRLIAYSVVLETFDLVAGTISYTIGPTGNWDTSRPQRIERANLLISADARQHIDVVDVDRWADIYSETTPTGQPDVMYNDRASPLSTLRFNLSPDSNYQVELYQWKPFTRFTNGETTVDFPPEFEEAIVYQLALRLASLDRKQVLPDVRDRANEALSDIVALNAIAPVMTVSDIRGTRTRGWGYNILTNR